MKQFFSLCNILLSALLLCVITYCDQAYAEMHKDSSDKCIIKSGGKTYKPSGCIIKKGTDEDLSWYILEKKDGSPLLEEITMVSIYEMSAGTADVSGLTSDGINSSWGNATRNGSCWSGEDFTICLGE